VVFHNILKFGLFDMFLYPLIVFVLLLFWIFNKQKMDNDFFPKKK